MMSEEELRRPSNQTNFKMEVKGPVQVHVLVHSHCIAQFNAKTVQC